METIKYEIPKTVSFADRKTQLHVDLRDSRIQLALAAALAACDDFPLRSQQDYRSDWWQGANLNNFQANILGAISVKPVVLVLSPVNGGKSTQPGHLFTHDSFVRLIQAVGKLCGASIGNVEGMDLFQIVTRVSYSDALAYDMGIAQALIAHQFLYNFGEMPLITEEARVISDGKPQVTERKYAPFCMNPFCLTALVANHSLFRSTLILLGTSWSNERDKGLSHYTGRKHSLKSVNPSGLIATVILAPKDVETLIVGHARGDFDLGREYCILAYLGINRILERTDAKLITTYTIEDGYVKD